jgi:hypothetical protein
MVTGLGKGLFYSPSPAPQSGGVDELRRWCVQEFDRIASVTQEGRSQFVRLDVLNAVPEKVYPGLVAFFSASIVGPTEGCYEYRSAGTWVKL